MWLNYWRSLTLHYLLGIFLAVALVGCVSIAAPTSTLEPSLTDQSILTDSPCTAPCWYGLELGKSTKADALMAARALSFIDPKEFPEMPDHYLYMAGLKEEDKDATSVTLQCRQPEKQGCVILRFVNDSLKEIWLFPNYAISLSQLVAHLGEPEYIQFSPTSAESPFCDMSVVWKQRGIGVGFYSGIRCNQAHKDQRVDRDLQTQIIRYMLPENSVLARIPDPGRDFPWAGFVEP